MRVLAVICGLIIAIRLCGAVLGAAPETASNPPMATRAGVLPPDVPPVIGAWFPQASEMRPGGYRDYLDAMVEHSHYNLLTTTMRDRESQMVDPTVHDWFKQAAVYARDRGIGVVLELDVRHSIPAFRKRYPEELQERLWLQEIDLGGATEEVVANVVYNQDHTDAICGATADGIGMERVYSYRKTPEGIDPDSVTDITASCRATKTAATTLSVAVPHDAGAPARHACIIARVTFDFPAVFGPHLIPFEAETIQQYADIPLAGLMKDEWGFPVAHDGNPRKNAFWFSRYQADAYAEATGGRDLVRDSLLMCMGERGRESQRQAAVNHLMRISYLRNTEIEQAFYRATKATFGPAAFVGTHATALPVPDVREFERNGLDWWSATRDYAQSDETTPYSCRTSMTKKFGGAVWYNQWYAPTPDSYEKLIWSYALAGGRMNFHIFYRALPPWSERGKDLLRTKVPRADCRIRLLNFISNAPVDCPVAVIFGHACATNWAGPGFNDAGTELANAFWRAGYYADLIPSSELAEKALRVDDEGGVWFGRQRYAAVVLYHPEFENAATAEFFQKAAQGKTALYRMGDWTRDFHAEPFDGNAALPNRMKVATDIQACADAVMAELRSGGIEPQTPATVTLPKPDGVGPISAALPSSGKSQLVDGTVILASGEKDALGDPIQTTIKVHGHDVVFDALGIAAVRLGKDGKLDAMAAGGLKSFRGGGTSIELAQRIDVAVWRDDQGRMHGVLQDWTGPVPASLSAITGDWLRLAVPAPLPITSTESEPALSIESLRCEYLDDPLAIDVPLPRLSWILDSNQRGQKQTAYRVLVASTAELLAADHADLWDSGKTESDQTTQLAYAGKPLVSRTRCFWKVQVWDKDGNASAWSKPATWSMGLLQPEDWRAKWIRYGETSAAATDASAGAPSPWLRKTFVLESEPERCLAYVNALGYYELYVNGQKVGNDVLGPAVLDYRSRSFYVTYDIAPLLRKGRNCVGLWLGRGWRVTSSPGVQTPGPVVRFQAEIAAGGKNVEIHSDESWKCRPSSYTTLGPWRYDQFGGECYDARLDNPAWNTADCDDASWARVELAPPSVAPAQSQPCPLNRIGQRIPAVACADLGNGRFEVDFGTNLTGWLRFKLPPLTAGQRVVIHYADRRYANALPEELSPGVNQPDHDETFESTEGKVRYQTFHQADEFISAGQPIEEFCNKFNYHGFRYAIIEGLPTKPSLDGVEALLIESDLESAGSFACSNELLNRIHRLNLWTIRCLDLGGYLVDCPHRERLGYGDGQVNAETCLMNLWMPNFYAKWLGDWRDGQDPRTGNLSHVAPLDNPDGGGGPGWGASLAGIAWRMYLHYGDRRVLEDCYDSTRRYVDHLESRCVDGILRTYGEKWDFIGDWVPPDRGKDTANWPPARANELFNNCYRVYLWELLEKTASTLGREGEARRCRAKLDEIRPLIHREFYDSNKRTYVLDEQPYQCFPLFVGVVPPSERDAVLQKLENGILVRRGGHLDSGMMGTYFLMQYLPTVQRDDLLFTIVNQKTYPGWGYMVEQGATTVWEQWNGYSSQIHSCFASIAGWFHNGLAGIQPDPAAPGYKNIIIRPAVVGDLTWVQSQHRSMHGTIISNWTRNDGTLTLDVTIPANTTATVYVSTTNVESVTEGGQPAGQAHGVKFLRAEKGCAVFAVESGKYSFAAAF